MSKKTLSILLTLILSILWVQMLTGCNSTTGEFHDGYFTAENKNASHGWYEFLTIYVSDGKIVSVEYNAKNDSGFIKSWDMDYMRNMNAVDGTYPNEYTRLYAKAFLDNQSTEGIDTISGATHSYATFIKLAEAVLEKARAGDTTVELVEIPPSE